MPIIAPPYGARSIIKDCAWHLPGFLNSEHCEQHIAPGIVEETFSTWVKQMTFNKGWPARIDPGHTMSRFGMPGVTYSYKDKPKPMHAITPMLQYVRAFVNELVGIEFNCIVLNTYAPGSGLYPHRDGTYIPQLGADPVIAAVSFGTARTFNLHPADPVTGKRIKKVEPISVVLGSGDLFVMHGKCDANYLHSIPEEPHLSGTRMSLTFRKHLT